MKHESRLLQLTCSTSRLHALFGKVKDVTLGGGHTIATLDGSNAMA